MNPPSIQVVNENGIPFNVILGKTTPCKDCDTVVKIYDARWANKKSFDELGQGVSSYYTKTFFEIKDGHGVNMWGGIPDWVLSAKNVSEIKEFINKNI